MGFLGYYTNSAGGLAGESRLGPAEGAKNRPGTSPETSRGTGLGGEGVILWHLGDEGDER